jgi:DNA transformation protein
MRDAFVAHALELLAALGSMKARRMFSGHGIYCDDLFFAIVLDDVLYLKADDHSRADFERAGCERFSYLRQGRPAQLNFYHAPEDAMDAPRRMLPWGKKALAAALRARAAKPAAPNTTGRAKRPVKNTRRRKP